MQGQNNIKTNKRPHLSLLPLFIIHYFTFILCNMSKYKLFFINVKNYNLYFF